MNFKTSQKDLFHIFYFSVLVVLITLNRVADSSSYFFLDYGLHLFACSSFNFYLLHLISQNNQSNSIRIYLFHYSLYIFLSYCVYYVLLEFVKKESLIVYLQFELLNIDIIPFLQWVLYALMFISFNNILNRIKITERLTWEKKEQLLESQKKQAETLYSAKLSKVEPTFFYSSIEKAERLLESGENAEDFIVKLSSFYRSQLSENVAKYSPILDEIKKIQVYCELSDINLKVTNNAPNETLLASGLLLLLIKEINLTSIELSLELNNECIEIRLNSLTKIKASISKFVSVFYSEFIIEETNELFFLSVME